MDEKQLKKDIDKFKKELADGINELALHHPELTWIGINIRPMNKARLEVDKDSIDLRVAWQGGQG
jgi:hypothetical protein